MHVKNKNKYQLFTYLFPAGGPELRVSFINYYIILYYIILYYIILYYTVQHLIYFLHLLCLHLHVPVSHLLSGESNTNLFPAEIWIKSPPEDLNLFRV